MIGGECVCGRGGRGGRLKCAPTHGTGRWWLMLVGVGVSGERCLRRRSSEHFHTLSVSCARHPANMLRDMEMFVNYVLLPTHEPVSLSVASTSKPDENARPS